MSSHKEAPGIVNDPAADNTDVYAFVSPDKPDHVTLIANYVPFEAPAGGPNFASFGDDVLYEIHIDNNGDAKPDVTYQFRFRTENTIPGTFLYNVGPIESLDSKNWNRRQYATIKKIMRPSGGGSNKTVLGAQSSCTQMTCFDNIYPLSFPFLLILTRDVHTNTRTSKIIVSASCKKKRDLKLSN